MNRHARIDEENWQENSDKKNIILVTILILTKRKLFQRILFRQLLSYSRFDSSYIRNFCNDRAIVIEDYRLFPRGRRLFQRQ